MYNVFFFFVDHPLDLLELIPENRKFLALKSMGCQKLQSRPRVKKRKIFKWGQTELGHHRMSTFRMLLQVSGRSLQAQMTHLSQQKALETRSAP